MDRSANLFENPTLLLGFWQTRTSRKGKVSLFATLERGVTVKRRPPSVWVEGKGIDPEDPAMVALAAALYAFVEMTDANDIAGFVGSRNGHTFIVPKKGLPLCVHKQTSGTTTTDSWQVMVYETYLAFKAGCAAAGILPPERKP